MVKIQAKTTVFLLTANSPITHVTPSRGRRITDALMVALHEREGEGGIKGGREEMQMKWEEEMQMKWEEEEGGKRCN